MKITMPKPTRNFIIEYWLLAWLRFARRYHSLVIGIWIALGLLSLGLSGTGLKINTDTRDMIDANTAYRQDQIAFEQAFPNFNNEILILIRAQSLEAAQIHAQDLSERLRQYPDKIQSIYSPALDPYFRQNGLLFLENSALEQQLATLSQTAPLIERLAIDPSLDRLFETVNTAINRGEIETINPFIAAIHKTILANLNGKSQPLSWAAAFSESNETPYQQVLSLNPILDNSRLRPAAEIETLIKQLSNSVKDSHNLQVQIFVTGNPILRSDELKTVSQGIGLAFLISFFCVGVILFLALRSWPLAGFTLISLLIAVSITAGIAALIFSSLNLVSIAFTVLMIGLGVDFAIHVLMHILHYKKGGLSQAAASYRSVRKIGLALFLTAPSTALAFLAFVPTRFSGISQLGIIAAIGVVTAFLVTTSFLPAVLRGVKPPKTTTPPKPIGLPSYNIPSGSLPPRLRHNLAMGLMLLGALACYCLPLARFDADPMALRSQKAPSVIAFNQLFDKAETVPYRLNYLVQDLERAHLAAEKFNSLTAVRSARTLTDFIPKDQEDKLELIDYTSIGLDYALSGQAALEPVDPDIILQLIKTLAQQDGPNAQALSQILNLWQKRSKSNPALITQSQSDIFRFWPYQLDSLQQQLSARLVTLNDVPDAIKARYQNAKGLVRVEITANGQVQQRTIRRRFIDAVKTQAQLLKTQLLSGQPASGPLQSEPLIDKNPIAGKLPVLAGSALSVEAAGDIIQSSMIQALLTALAWVSLLLWGIIRSVRMIVIILSPLILAAILTTATGVILNLPYNFANVIVLPLLIGIGVDSSLHLALQNKTRKTAISASQAITARAVIYSGLTTIASFASLTFSEHRGTASMGALLTIAIFWVIICTIIITPSLLDWFGNQPSSRKIVRDND